MSPSDCRSSTTGSATIIRSTSQHGISRSTPGIFKKWAGEAGGAPITCSRLAELTGADELLIRRMMRAISGQFLVQEIDQDTYARTPWVKALADGPLFAGMHGGFYYELNSQMFRTLPFFLKETGFKNPINVDDRNLQFWQGDKNANMFQYVGMNPRLTSDFNDAMECHSKYNLTPWVDIYPTDTALASAANTDGDESRPLVVDIGGGKGHDLKKFLARHPDTAPRSLVLQDLPEIIKGVDVDPVIKVQPHNFFTPQPAESQGPTSP